MRLNTSLRIIAAPMGDSLTAVEQQLQRSTPVPQFLHGWDKVAQQHDAIYRIFSKEGLL
jgi:hypothetical protein